MHSGATIAIGRDAVTSPYVIPAFIAGIQFVRSYSRPSFPLAHERGHARLTLCHSVLGCYNTSTGNGMTQWNDTQPIFLQIRQRMIDMILKGTIAEGDALPSVRQVATDLSVNPLTVTKAYEALVDLGTVEKRRGVGLFVTHGAREALRAHERDKFLSEEWPGILSRIAALGLSIDDLIAGKEPKA